MSIRLDYNGDPNSTLANVSEAKLDEYNRVYRPLNREMIAGADSTAMVDAAKNDTNPAFDASEQRSRRMAQRYGINFSAVEQNERTHQNAAARSLNFDNTVNRARLGQYERNNQVRNDMIAVGRGIDTSAMQQLGQAASLQTQRENQNNQISAQNDAARSQMMGAVGSAAMMAAIMFM